MCGRFAQIEPIDVIARQLNIEEVIVANTTPRYNICPGEDIVALVFDNTLKLVEYRWGLIPFWVKDISNTKPLINARTETITQKPSFKKAFLYNRCIIPASGFYEWKKIGNKKIPYYITIKDFFGFAGIYDSVTIHNSTLTTCAILTTQANEQMSSIHDRMPVILRQAEFNQWVNPSTSMDSIMHLLKPLDTEMIMYPISTKVNNPSYKEPDCISPVNYEQ